MNDIITGWKIYNSRINKYWSYGGWTKDGKVYTRLNDLSNAIHSLYSDDGLEIHTLSITITDKVSLKEYKQGKE